MNPNGAELPTATSNTGPPPVWVNRPLHPCSTPAETPTPVTATIRKLHPNTTYHFRITATNSNGTTSGTDQTLKTLPTAPTVQTKPADVGDPDHSDAERHRKFRRRRNQDCSLEYGPTTSYGSTAPAPPNPAAAKPDAGRRQRFPGPRPHRHLPLPHRRHQRQRQHRGMTKPSKHSQRPPRPDGAPPA